MRVGHIQKEKCSHYIGRPTLLGNRFSHKPSSVPGTVQVSTVEEALRLCEQDFRSRPEVLKAIRSLPENAVLGCWCKQPGKPETPCHGDVIIKLWKELHAKE